MSYKYNLEIKNESGNAEIFEQYLEDIRAHIYNELTQCFDFNINLLVIFRDLDNETNFVNQETTNGGSVYYKKRYIILLNINSLKRIPFDRGLDFAIAVRHELAHIYDFYHTLHNKFYKFQSLSKKSYHSVFDMIINIGWRFWSEFFAYYHTFKKFKNEHNYPTMLQIVSSYELLIEQYECLMAAGYSEDDECQKKAQSLLGNIEDFVYAISKFMSGYLFGKKKNYDYCDKTAGKKSFIQVQRLIDGLYRRIVPMLTNTYGKGEARKMFNLGDYIMRRIYCRLGCGIVKSDGKAHLAVYF